MNEDVQSLKQALDWIRKSFPANLLIHVGAGRGAGTVHQWQSWDVPKALLFEPHIQPDSRMQSRLEQQPGWKWLASTLSDQEVETEFFNATNPLESGLLDPAKLQKLWPNLRSLETNRVTTRRLDSLLDELECDERIDWLIVDCLPALPVLRGAGELLGECQVIWVRVILEKSRLDLPGCTLTDIDNFLKPLCFRCAAQFESLHPAIGEAIFVRDWPAYLQKRTGELLQAHGQDKDAWQMERQGLLSECSALTSHVDELTSARDAEAKAKAEALAQRDAEAKAKADAQARTVALEQAQKELIAARDALAQEKAALIQARNAEAAARAEAQTRLAALEQSQSELAGVRDQLAQERADLLAARDAESKAKAEALAQRDAEAAARVEAQTHIAALEQSQSELAGVRDRLAQEKSELLVQHEALDKETKELANSVTDRQSTIEKLRTEITERESELAECRHRQSLMNDELLKAEAQIELIKDLLLREPGL